MRRRGIEDFAKLQDAIERWEEKLDRACRMLLSYRRQKKRLEARIMKESTAIELCSACGLPLDVHLASGCTWGVDPADKIADD